jgi:hypothetical protein
MNRPSILILSSIVVVGLALLPVSAAAQQKTLQEQLVGTWTLISNDITPPNGAKQAFYGSGANPRGILVLDAGGRYALVQGRPDRPKFKSASRLELDATPEVLKAAVLGFGANIGTWSVNESDKTLVRKYELALIPNNDGLERKDTVSLAGEELKLIRTVNRGSVSAS